MNDQSFMVIRFRDNGQFASCLSATGEEKQSAADLNAELWAICPTRDQADRIAETMNRPRNIVSRHVRNRYVREDGKRI